jgi:hypothetical protein
MLTIYKPVSNHFCSREREGGGWVEGATNTLKVELRTIQYIRIRKKTSYVNGCMGPPEEYMLVLSH